MAKGPDHYEMLGVNRKATIDEIRRAYRRLALKIHPDRSKAPDAAERFTRLTQAYEVLRDPEARRRYDEELTRAEYRVQPGPATAKPAPGPKPKKVATAQKMMVPETARLAALFSRGKFDDAEDLAERIIENFPREALAYAILGDIARARGQMARASKLYAYAVQMDPRNHAFQQRYEDLLRSMGVTQVSETSSPVTASAAAFGVALLACVYLIVAKEKPLFRNDLPFISTWTLGCLVMLFLTGVGAGVSLSLGRMLDRFSSVSVTALGRISPTVALATVAIVNFWAATALYLLLGLTQQSFNFSATRLIGASVAGLFILTMGASLSGSIDAGQVLLWGGNVLYLGSISGWMVGDALRRG